MVDIGSSFSVEQKQRVPLALALYQRPKLLFLDNATSYLDAQYETLTHEAVKQFPSTRVIVAHRSRTIAAVGRAVQLDAGMVVLDSQSKENPEFRSC